MSLKKKKAKRSKPKKRAKTIPQRGGEEVFMKVDYKVLGGRVTEVDLPTRATVGTLKSKANLSKHTASVNGEPADDNYELRDGDYVTLSEAVKGA